MKKIYITTTLPYLNGKPHIGHAFEFLRADCLARYYRKKGDEVFFNLGTDEHGQKIYEKAKEENIPINEFLKNNLVYFKNLIEKLNLDKHNFIRTTEDRHKKAVEHLWQEAKADIYKKKYQGLYCLAEEDFILKKDLIDGKCPNGKEPILIEEENYFFAFSKFKNQLRELYKKRDFIFPEKRLNEMKNILESIDDFSVSRLKSKMPYGIDVPGDDEHIVYVWFDALMSYLSTLGYPKETGIKWNDFDKRIQFCGKDNLKFQAGYFQAMLGALGLKHTDHICIGGHILAGGKKMSKSLGNVIDPIEIIDEYGADAFRWYFLKYNFEDINFTKEHFEQVYTGELVNGIGNLSARILEFIFSFNGEEKEKSINLDLEIKDCPLPDCLESFDFNRYLNYISEKISALDKDFTDWKPFAVAKNRDYKKTQEILQESFDRLNEIFSLLEIIMPEYYNNFIQSIENYDYEQIKFCRKKNKEF